MTQNLRMVKDNDLLVLRERAKALLTELNIDYFTVLGRYEIGAANLKDDKVSQEVRVKWRVQLKPLELKLDELEARVKAQRQFCVAIQNELARREWLITMDPRILAILAEDKSLGRARGGKGKEEGGG